MKFRVKREVDRPHPLPASPNLSESAPEKQYED